MHSLNFFFRKRSKLLPTYFREVTRTDVCLVEHETFIAMHFWNDGCDALSFVAISHYYCARSKYRYFNQFFNLYFLVLLKQNKM